MGCRPINQSANNRGETDMREDIIGVACVILVVALEFLVVALGII